jgi:hypothetical protein
MKNTLLLLLLTAFPFSVFTQNWQPFPGNLSLNYYNKSENLFYTIYPDSIKTTTSDKVFYFNRVMKKVVDYNGIYDGYCSKWLDNKSQFFLDEMKYLPSSGMAVFRDSSSLFIIKSKAGLNDSWIFDSINNITATIVGLGVKTIFSNTDSVKTIGLSTGDTIELSKNYGIIRFPVFDTLMNYVELAGDNTNKKGDIIPSVNDIFKFSTGDTLYYYGISHGRWSLTKKYQRIVIKSVVKNVDTLIISTKLDSYSVVKNNYSSEEDTLYYTDNNYQLKYVTTKTILTKEPFKRTAEMSRLYCSNNKPVLVSRDTIFGVPVIKRSIPSYAFVKKLNNDTIVCTVRSDEGPYFYTESYAENFGMIYTSFSENSIGGGGNSLTLIGMVHNGKKYGKTILNSVFDTTADGSSLTINVFPNPSVESLSIMISRVNQISDINIYDITGNIVFHTTEIKDKNIINILSWHAGVYFVVVRGEDKTITKKIIKL